MEETLIRVEAVVEAEVHREGVNSHLEVGEVVEVLQRTREWKKLTSIFNDT